MEYTVDIDETNTVRIWQEDRPLEDEPNFIQDIHPDGRPWESLEEATEWAEATVALLKGAGVVETPEEI